MLIIGRMPVTLVKPPTLLSPQRCTASVAASRSPDDYVHRRAPGPPNRSSTRLWELGRAEIYPPLETSGNEKNISDKPYVMYTPDG